MLGDYVFSPDHAYMDCNFGRIHDPESTQIFAQSLPNQNLYQANPALQGTSDDTEVFLWEAELLVTGSKEPRPPHHQTIGDCTSHGTSGALEDLQYIQIGWRGMPGEFHMVASEALYGAGRVDIGGGHSFGDGAVTAWLIQAAMKEGFLARQPYDDGQGHTIDLTNYSGSVAKAMGNKGVPSWLKPLMLKHLLQGAVQAHSADEACDGMRNGHPVVVGSNVGFSMTRDSDGFCRRGPRWDHCTYFRGYTKVPGKRQGVVYQQSWGPGMPSGPRNITTPGGKQIILPEGAYFIDMEVFDTMIKQGDGWILSASTNFEGLDFNIT